MSKPPSPDYRLLALAIVALLAGGAAIVIVALLAGRVL